MSENGYHNEAKMFEQIRATTARIKKAPGVSPEKFHFQPKTAVADKESSGRQPGEVSLST